MIDRRTFLAAAGALAASSWRPDLAMAGTGCPGTLLDAGLDAFRASLSGGLVLPSDPSYPSRRLVNARRFSPRPMMIVDAASTDDVVRAIAFARAQGLRLVPRSGGHSYVGASGNDGLMLDVSGLNAIEASADGSTVTIGAGARLGAIYSALYCAHGRTIPSGTCPSVGIAGITLGGGYSLGARQFGLTLDRLISATVVLASGETVVASEESHPELFWALRGGGSGAFGVVTELTFATVPFRPLVLANLFYRWPDAEAGFAAWQEFTLSDPDRRVVPTAGFSSNPSGTAPSFRASVVVDGTVAEAQALLLALRAPGVKPLSTSAYPLAIPACPGSVVGAGTYAKYKSALPSAPLGPEALAIIRERLEARRVDPVIPLAQGGGIQINSFGGAIADVSPGATAFAHRDALFSLQFFTEWNPSTPPATVAAHLAWIRGLYDGIRPHLGPACYYNYADEDLPDWPTAYWGANLPALQQVKATYDPDGFFRGRHTVPLPGKA
jgi:FAD/FMN-containing dehydrogenase